MHLFTVNFKGQDLAKLKKSGLKYPIQAERLVKDLSITAIRAFQSKVPIDTGELRSDITTGDIREDGYNSSVDIIVEDVQHTGRRGHPVSAEALANVLQQGSGRLSKDPKIFISKELHRSRTSKADPPFTAIGKGEPTAGWIDKGREAFLRQYKKILTNGR